MSTSKLGTYESRRLCQPFEIPVDVPLHIDLDSSFIRRPFAESFTRLSKNAHYCIVSSLIGHSPTAIGNALKSTVFSGRGRWQNGNIPVALSCVEV